MFMLCGLCFSSAAWGQCTSTTNIGFQVPNIGAATGWGPCLNTDLADLDTLLGGSQTLTAASATPSVASLYGTWLTANTSAQAITNFTGGFAGQTIKIICGSSDTFTSLASGTNLSLAGSWSCSSSKSITLVLVGAVWTEVSRSFIASGSMVYPAAGIPDSLGTSWGTSYGASSPIPLTFLPAQTANTVLGSLTAVSPSGLAVPSCSGASNALIWTSGTGFGCNTISSSGLTFPVTVAGTTTSGGIPYFSSTTALTSSALLPSGDFVLGGGAGAAPAATFSIVPPVNGGTGVASPTAHSFLVGEGASSFNAVTCPATNGLYSLAANVTSSAAVDPSCIQVGLTPRAVTATPDTVAFGDVSTILDAQGSITLTENLPTQTTLGNAHFSFRETNVTPNTMEMSAVTNTFQSNGTTALNIPEGQSCLFDIDGATSTIWDDFCSDPPLTATSPLVLTRAQYSLGISCPTCSTSSSGPPTITVANAATTGTTANTLTKLTGAPSTAVIAATTDTGGIVGIVSTGAGTTGSATIQIAGTINCVFDGATTAGDYVQISSTTAGDCKDTGAGTYPTSNQVIGRVLSTNAAAGTYSMDLFPAEIKAASGGGSSVIYSTQTSETGASVSATAMVTPGANHIYKFSATVVQTGATAACTVQPSIDVSVQYKDSISGLATGFQTLILNSSGNAVLAGNFTQSSGNLPEVFFTSPVLINAASGTALNYAAIYTAGTGCTTGAAYTVQPFLEQVQ